MENGIKSVIWDLLIVKSGEEHIHKVANDILDLSIDVNPKKRITTRNVSDKSRESRSLKCSKIIFLLSTASGDQQLAIQDWVTEITQVNNNKAPVLIVNEVQQQSARYSYQFWDERNKLCNLKTHNIKSLADLFSWWPTVLEFMYSSDNRTPSKYSCEVSLSSSAMSKQDETQVQLKENFEKLVSGFGRGSSQSDEFRKHVIFVVFGRDISLSFAACKRFRQAKVNGSSVIFMFTTTPQLNNTIRETSNLRFYADSQMRAMLYLFCLFSSGTTTISTPLPPSAPGEPLAVTKHGIYWRRLGQLGNQTYSLQQRGINTGTWEEMNPKIPIFETSFEMERRKDDQTTEYRLVQEDEQGLMSEPLNYTETWGEYCGRKALAALFVLLSFPTICLVIATAPFSLGIFCVYRACTSQLCSSTNLDKNSNVALLMFWLFCSVAFAGGVAAIVLQHAYGTLNLAAFWVGLLVPFTLLCLNYMIRSQFLKYSDCNLLTDNVPMYVIPPFDIVYVFWTKPYASLPDD